MRWLSGISVIIAALAGAWLLQFTLGDTHVMTPEAEMLAGPALGMIAVVLAFLSYRAATTPNYLRGIALLVSGLVVMMWLGVDVLTWVTMQNCPDGVC